MPKVIKRWDMDTVHIVPWSALLMDDNTLHFVNPEQGTDDTYTPVSAEPNPSKWIYADRDDDDQGAEAVILDDGNLLLHKPDDDEFYHAVYYLNDETTA